MTGGMAHTHLERDSVIFATNGGKINISGTWIYSTEDYSRAIHATYGGIIAVNNANLTTYGNSSATLFANKGKGMINCTSCNLETRREFEGSRLIYSAGGSTINVINTIGNSYFGQAVVLDGRSDVSVRSSHLKCSTPKYDKTSIRYCVLIYKSSILEEAGIGKFTCENSILEISYMLYNYSDTPLIYVLNTEADIYLTNCSFIYESGNIIKIDQSNATLTLTNQKIKGNIEFFVSSSLILKLINSTIEGAINSFKYAIKLEIILDADSSIILTGNSYYTSFYNAVSDNSNIITDIYTFSDYNGVSPFNSGTNIPSEKPEISDQSQQINSSTIINEGNNNSSSNASNATNESSSVVLLGFSHFKKGDDGKSFSFYIYFVRLLNSILSRILTFPIIVTHNSALRFLQNTEETEAICTLEGTGTEAKLQFNCKTQTTETSNIGQIKIIPKFNFGGQKVNLDSITPLANNYMDNIQDIGDKFNYLSSSNVYILDKSLYHKHDNGFYISGIMNDPQPNFGTSSNLVINITLNSSSTISETAANCDIDEIKNNNYTLNCQPNENINSKNLQVALSKVDEDNILLINFLQQSQEDQEDGEATQSQKNYIRKSSSGLSAGAIVAIIVVPIIALAIIAGVIIFFVKRKSPPKTENS